MSRTSCTVHYRLAGLVPAVVGGILFAACALAGTGTIQLAELDGSNGFRLDGESVGDATGLSVAGAGDVNGDGIADLLIGAPFADSNGSLGGSSFVVFGRVDGFVARLDLSALDGSNGFRLTGTTAFDRSGYSVAGAGDINGDGFDDLLVGAPFADSNGSSSGSSYVVFGRNSFPANVSLGALNGSDGFRMDGAAGYYFSGGSVAAAGDINHDGFDDLIIGAIYPFPKGDYPGRSYVVFGHGGSFATSLDLGALDGNDGFVLDGLEAGAQSRLAVAGAGDLNADGTDDLVVGASLASPNGYASGSTYVVFGHGGAFPGSVQLDLLDGHDGFRVDGIAMGQFCGLSVAGIGDINADGIDDLAMSKTGDGTSAGSTYVLFGHAGVFPASLRLDMFDGSNGFHLDGAAPVDYSGYSIAGRGDFNDDGIADLLVGAPGADPNGDGSGSSYVSYGHPGIFPASFGLGSLDGANGFRLDGATQGDASGISVANAGDVNGDGVDDLLIGASNAGPKTGGAGSAYVVFGRGDIVFCDGFDGIDCQPNPQARDTTHDREDSHD